MTLFKTSTRPDPAKAEPSTIEGTVSRDTNLRWNGKPLSNAALNLVVLLWANRIPEIPAFILLRPQVQCYRWTQSGEICIERHNFFSKFIELFSLGILDDPSSLAGASNCTLLPCDSFAWFCQDLGPEPISVYPGDEMQRLISESALVVNVKHDLVYLGLSQQLREDVSQISMRTLEDARLELVSLVILSLPEPYTEPLWEIALLRCYDVIKSTVMPFLLSTDIKELLSLSRITDARGAKCFESYFFLLPFNLVRLGFKIHVINWENLFQEAPYPYTHFAGTLTLISEMPKVMDWPDMVTQLKSLRQSNFFWSLIGFNIAQTQNTSTNPSYMIWHDRISTFWLEQGQPSGSMMEKAAWSLVGQKEQAEDFLRELPPEVQVSLGVAFNAEGYPDTGCALLERYLKHVDSTRPPAYKPTRSVVYGHLFAELVNNRNALHDGKRLISWGFKLSRLRDEEKLGARLDSINIKLSVADTHTILADYDTAIDLLHQVLSVRNLQPYIHIVSTLRLNKIGRRIDRFESHIGEYLKAASLLVIEEEVEVQKEFLAELAATLAHVKHIEVDNPYHSDLCETVHKTIYLYEDHPILRDDWRLQKIKSMMGKMLPVGWSPNSAKQPLLEQVTADPVNTATKPMFDEIFVHLVPSKFDDRTEYFLPEDSVSKILNRESVRGAMKIESLPENDKLVDFILTKAPKVFLISIFSGLEEETLHLAMTSVQEANLTDVYLPISDLFDFQMPEWTPVMANNFYQQQWKFLAPVFTPDQFYYLFDPLCILPVIEKGKELKVGGISQVTKVEIHKAHFKANDAEIVGHQLFALKTICQADIWAGDMEAMNSAHSLKHPNIVKPIAAFQIGLIGAVNRYFMLEWADGGNLRDLWMSHPQPTRTPDLIKDVVRQLFDLTRALSAVHADHTRHGGLKPENILRFTNREDTLIGTLKLGDWGFARRQMNVTRLRDDVTTTKHETRRYEPPESDERSEVYIDRSRLSDVWAMGCIILEFMVWLLYGEEGLNKFDRDVSRSSSEDHVFYQLSKDVSGIEFKVKDAVAEWMDMMSRHTDCKSNTAMGDLLIIVKTKLLVVDLPRSAMEHSSGSLEAPVIRFEPPVEPGGVALNQVTALPLARADQRQRRAQASDLQKGLESILQREATNDSYWPTSCTNSSKANDDEDDEDDEGDFSRDGPRFPQPEGSLDRKKFKCPFYKYHPALYRNCERLRMASISYVTQHILRRHVLKQCTMDVQETSQSTDGNPIYLPRTTDPDKIVFYCPKCRDEFRGPGADVRSERHPACEAKSTAQTGVLLPAEFERLKKEVTATSGNDNKWEKIWTTLFPGTSMPTQYSEAEIVAPVGVDARPHNTFQYYPFAGVPIETHHHDPPQIFDPRMPDFMQVPDPYLGDEGFFNFFQDHHWDMANNTGNLDYAPSHIPNSAPTDETPTRRPGRFDPDFIQNSPFPNNAWWAHDNYHGTQ